MKILLILGAAVAALVAVVALVGYSLPVQHVASRSVSLRAPADRVWELLSAHERGAERRPGVRSVELLSRPAGKAWRETSTDGEVIEYELLESQPGSRLVQRIASAGLPFGGTWTLEIAPSPGGGPTLTVTERGEVYNPIFRFVSRFILGHAATIDRYLEAVKAKLEQA